MISKRHTTAIVLAAALGVLGMASAGLAADPPGQRPCNHGNSGKECKPDPQPEHGAECVEHGPHEGGVNADHCLSSTPGTTIVGTTTGGTTTTVAANSTPEVASEVTTGAVEPSTPNSTQQPAEETPAQPAQSVEARPVTGNPSEEQTIVTPETDPTHEGHAEGRRDRHAAALPRDWKTRVFRTFRDLTRKQWQRHLPTWTERAPRVASGRTVAAA
jgi:hypothetical protein